MYSVMGAWSIEECGYHRWLHLHMLDVCATPSDEQLQLPSPGTYGTIAATWLHLLAAEQRYLRRLVGSEPQLSERKEFPGIAVLKEEASRTGDELIEAAAKIKPDEVIDTKYGEESIRLNLRVVIIQGLHPGHDHRTHSYTTLAHADIPHGHME